MDLKRKDYFMMNDESVTKGDYGIKAVNKEVSMKTVDLHMIT